MPFETKQTDLASGVVVLAVSGSMTMGGELQRFEWQVERLIKENKKRLVLEASQLTYLDSAGIGVLVKISGLAKGAGGRLHLAAPTERVMNTLKMVSLDTLLAIDANLEAAVAALS